MPRYRLLAIDVDGTLVNRDDEVTGATRDAIRRALDAGIEVMLATGRRYSRALPLVEPLGLNMPLVTASGALIKQAIDHQTLYMAEFDPPVLTDMLSHITTRGYETVLFGDTYHQGFDYYSARLVVERSELMDFFRLNEGRGRQWPDLCMRPPDGIFGGFAMGTRDEMLQLQHELAQQMPGMLSAHVMRTSRYQGFMCELAPAGVSKWSAIQLLAHRHGIPDEAICAVGDDVNDLPMIQGAGLGIAMGNAAPEVKAVADRIAPSNNDDGIVEVVRWLLEE